LCPRLSANDSYEKDYNKPTYRNIGGKYVEGKLDCSSEDVIAMELEPTVVIVEDTTVENIRRQQERKLKKQRRKLAQKATTDMTDSAKRATLGAITLREYPWGAMNASDGGNASVHIVNPILTMLFLAMGNIPSTPSHRLSIYLKPVADIVRTTHTEVVDKQLAVTHDTALYTAISTGKRIPTLFKEFGMKQSTLSVPNNLYAVLFSAYVMNKAYRPYPFLKHTVSDKTVEYDKDVRHVVFSMEGAILRHFTMPPPSDKEATAHMESFCDICNEYGHDRTYEFHRTHDINLGKVREIRADVVEGGKDGERVRQEYVVYDENTEIVVFYVPRSVRRFHRKTQTYEDYEPPVRVVCPERLENDLHLVAVVTDDRHLYFRNEDTWYHYHGEFSPTLETSFYKKVGSYANLMATANDVVGRRGLLYAFRFLGKSEAKK